MSTEIFAFILPFIWLGILIFLITLAVRLVKAVERIADILGGNL
jgi:hypothetical protein